MPFYKRFSFWLFLAAVFIIVFLFAKRTFNAVEVKTLPVKKQELTITVTATSTGTIKSDKEVRVTAQRVGKISRLFVEEGNIVSPGADIAELDSEEGLLNLKIAQASLDKADAVLKEVEARVSRFNELKAKGYISQGDMDSVLREYDVAGSNVKEAKNSLSIAQLNYDYSFIKSPIYGVITSRPVKLGDTATKGSLIVNVVSLENLYVEAFIDEADVAKVKLGQDVDISMDAYQGQVFKGRVYMISPVVLGGKLETRTFEARMRFKEKSVVIKPGMSADVEIIVDSVTDAVVVPAQAIVEKDGKKFVFIRKGSRASLVAVETGRFNWNFTEITTGIKEGDIVIINPDAPGLDDGKRIKESK